jgi:hypothetical protein
MKLCLKMKSYVKVGLSLLLLGLSLTIFAQGGGKRLSGGVALGIPVTFFSVKSAPIGIYAGSVRYSFNKSWSLEGKLSSNTFYANPNNPPKATLDGTPSDIVSYRTPVYSLNAIVHYNLHTIFGLNRMPESKWLPYVNGGFGYNWYKPSATFANGATSAMEEFAKPYRDFQLGIGTRYYINANLDLFGGAEYHLAETYSLDALKEATNPSLDQFLNFYAGVSVKFGAKPWDNLIDWNHKNVEDPKEFPKDYTKWSADANIGLPILFSPVGGYNLTGMFGLGVRRSFSSSMGIGLNYNYGHFSGDQTTVPTAVFGTPEAVKEYVTKISQITLRAYFNLRNLGGEPESRREWNHYASLGGGYISAKGDATFANGSSINDEDLTQSIGVQNVVIGYQARKYINPMFDFVAGVDFSYNQSKWLDQGGLKPTLNHHLYLNAGITYKIRASKDREHIDWAYGTYNNFTFKTATVEQVPVLAPVVEQPKIDTSLAVAPVAETTPAPVAEPTTAATPAPAVVTIEPVKQVPAENRPVVSPAPKTVPVLEKGKVGPPSSKYNVIVACYSINKLSVARANQQRLERKGFAPSIYRSSKASKLLRMSIISTDDRSEAITTLRRVRREIEPNSWIYIYNAQ